MTFRAFVYEKSNIKGAAFMRVIERSKFSDGRTLSM